MSAEVKKEIELEIAHVLFLDIVGYSKLSVNEQHGRVDELNGIVRLSEQFQKAEAANRILKIPTGDGMALVFYRSPEEPAQCAFEISRALKNNPRLQVRMGIHSGPVSGVVDVNERTNVAGAGINLAQRVMDCGDAGHILLSHHVAEDLAEYERWRPFLHDIGTFEVKHGARVSVTNLYSDEVGNPQRPKKFHAIKKQLTRLRWAVVAVGLLVLAALAAGVLSFLRKGPARSLATAVEKSIAVLPFENLSEEKANAFFTEGVQDEILTHLARIADLKVISRTSVMQYKSGAPRNLREIGQQLGVAHVLEGSVQRAGNRVRVNAQLIDARNDAHLWAQSYDRDLADVFAIQTEIAKAIADQLQAKLSLNEKRDIEQAPTADVSAFEFYSRARPLVDPLNISDEKTNLLRAAELLNQAVTRDPSFFDAYCRLAYAHDRMYFAGYDHTPARLSLAEAAIENAFRLRPDAGESHLARARNLYFGYLDYGGALAQLEVARETLPNDPQVLLLKAAIERRQARWEESTRSFDRAVELDPRNTFVLDQAALNYLFLRRYPELDAALARLLAIAPNELNARAKRALAEFFWHGDNRALRQIVSSVEATNPEALPKIANPRLICALAERNAKAAEEALKAFGENKPTLGINNVLLPRLFVEGLIAWMTKDEEKARSAFTAARAEQEKTVQAQPNYGPAWCVLGLIDAGLGRKEEALREGRHAMELLPVGKDAINGHVMMEYFSVIAAWIGDNDLACEQLATAIRLPGPLSYGQLKLFPFWDPLRGDSRFQELLEQIKQPIAFNPGKISAPEKSIAVLPFENRSRDPDNAFFTDGVQDEILTDLARIADLKVISRTSVMQYRTDAKRNLRQIRNELDVAHVVEGSVQRAGNRVRVNAQLIDARTDAHLWAQTYDRDLADVFAIQREIAKTIAEQLQAKLSLTEKAAIEQRPTADLAAFDLYTRAKMLRQTNSRVLGTNNRLQAVGLLNQAVALDPTFLLAWCELAITHDLLYFLDHDHTATRLALAKAAVQTALRLRPNQGEAHLALAHHLYQGYLDYDRARAELAIAQRTLPNDPFIFVVAGIMDRRQGRWAESTRNLERVIELDPRNSYAFQNLSFDYQDLRRYADMAAVLDHALAIAPKDVHMRVECALIDLDWRADSRPLHTTIEAILVEDPGAAATLANHWLVLALCERDPVAAAQALVALSDNTFGPEVIPLYRPFGEGVVARVRGDAAAARSAFTIARVQQEEATRAQPDYAPALCALGLIDAGLGRKQEALREGRRAVELLPVARDSLGGEDMIQGFAIICAWVDEKDHALQKLAISAQIPGGVTYGQLKLHPFWDPLRGDPRFEKIVASLAPK